MSDQQLQAPNILPPFNLRSSPSLCPTAISHFERCTHHRATSPLCTTTTTHAPPSGDATSARSVTRTIANGTTQDGPDPGRVNHDQKEADRAVTVLKTRRGTQDVVRAWRLTFPRTDKDTLDLRTPAAMGEDGRGTTWCTRGEHVRSGTNTTIPISTTNPLMTMISGNGGMTMVTAGPGRGANMMRRGSTMMSTDRRRGGVDREVPFAMLGDRRIRSYSKACRMM